MAEQFVDKYTYKKKLLLYSALKLTFRIKEIKKIRLPKMRRNNYLESKYLPGAGQTRDNGKKIFRVAW